MGLKTGDLDLDLLINLPWNLKILCNSLWVQQLLNRRNFTFNLSCVLII